MLRNRVRKSFRKLKPLFEQRNIGAFRLYDRDIPEIRAAVDWVEGHLVIAEFARSQTGPSWLEQMARAVAEELEVPWERVHLRTRRTRPGEGERYSKLAATGERLQVRERDLRFWVNLDDYLDIGLFPDHRETRALVRAEASGADFLNLFSYTGSFTCAAMKGGARSSLSVDASAAYSRWAEENLALNGLGGEVLRSEVDAFLETTQRTFSLCVLDPPSFSDRGGSFDVQRDHKRLIERTLRVLRPGGVLWFSTNHQRFEPQLDGLQAVELTAKTVPVDYRNSPHRSFRMIR